MCTSDKVENFFRQTSKIGTSADVYPENRVEEKIPVEEGSGHFHHHRRGVYRELENDLYHDSLHLPLQTMMAARSLQAVLPCCLQSFGLIGHLVCNRKIEI